MLQSKFRSSGLLPQKLQGSFRDIRAQVPIAARCNAEQKQAGAAADLPDALWMQRENPLNRRFHPDPHFFGRDGLPGVATVPANDVEGRIDVISVVAIGFVECRSPQ